ncbi:CocE/NonD family hydrolase [Streptomyces sp. ID05-04B]|uniref:CocE/NonD family hydrolase n=1 Tax=unclassified Streptomyces TaxID=2593676 RepID=UPI000D1BA615|nr:MULTISPECIES: CocE/NonD family hydrolase [unclassified Streptomyces]AVV44867.1 hydrolase [Streptomyces sp. P3]MDX5566204.1 CocE/NonD family hydrolase [Streptomyces sp. ID05-04B]
MPTTLPPPAPPSLTARTTDRILTRLMRLPGPRYGYRVERNLPTPARDGAVLVTDHYAPVTDRPKGTVLLRTPYGRGLPHDLEARVYAGHGFHVVLQSCRGTFGSTGDFYPMANEADDAQDAVAWLRTRPWFDGRLATAGGSYVGWTQWALLMDPPPELRTCLIAVAPHNMHETVYGAGAFQLGDFLSWAAMMAGQERFTGLRGVARVLTMNRRLAPVFGSLPLADAADAATEHRTPWFREWLTTPDPDDPLWDGLKLDDALQRANVPVRLTAGWQDLFLDQTLHQYRTLRTRGVDVSLTVGPWTHQELSQKGMGRLLRSNLEWLRTHLADDETPASRPPGIRVEVYVTGQGAWRRLEEWPPAAAETVRYLQPDGKLLADEPSGGAPSTFVYDPANPTPTLGGPLLTLDSGVKDNADLQDRPDVLTFTTPPLTAPLEIIGTPVVELAHTRSNPHADVFVRLCDVDPKGIARNFAEGLLRLDSTSPIDQVQYVRVRLDACAHEVRPGHRIRLLTAGGSHPRYARNEGTGAAPGTGHELRPCTHTIHHDTGAVSRVLLPTPAPNRPVRHGLTDSTVS